MPRWRVQIIQGWRRLELGNLLPEMQGEIDYRNQGRQNHYSKSIGKQNVTIE